MPIDRDRAVGRPSDRRPAARSRRGGHRAPGSPGARAAPVHAALELLRSEGDAAIDEFLERAADPAWLAGHDRDPLVTELRAVREAVRGVDDDIAVEAEPDGVRLELAGGGVERTVRVRISEAGVGGVELVAEIGETPGADDDGGRQAAVRSHVRALETSSRRQLDEVVAEFERDRFSAAFLAETTQTERRALLGAAREAAGSAGGVALDEDDGELSLRLLSPGREVVVRFRVGHQPPFAIDALRVEEGEPPVPLASDELDGTFRELEEDGFAGVVHFARGGEVVLERGYGPANPELGHPVGLDTAFGIGSTPIDFTVAGLLLLAQRGELALDDPITEHLEGVPADKASITLRHLITGQSGLPDFHDQPADWDPDLAWIDRGTAVRRILAQPHGPGRANSMPDPVCSLRRLGYRQRWPALQRR